MLHPQTADEKRQRHQQRDVYEPRFPIEPGQHRSQSYCDQHECQPDRDIDPKQGADLIMADLLALDGRLGEAKIRKRLAQARDGRTMATSPKSAGVSSRASTTVEIDWIRNWAPCDVTCHQSSANRPAFQVCMQMLGAKRVQ